MEDLNVKKSRKNSRRRKSRLPWIAGIALCLFLGSGLVLFFIRSRLLEAVEKPEEIMVRYAALLSEHNYENLYDMLDNESRLNISIEDFVTRNKKIYEGIEAAKIQVQIVSQEENEDDSILLYYQMSLDSIAGDITFKNQVNFTKDDESGKYLLSWDDNVIFPGLGSTDKVRVHTNKADRGEILDRNGRMLAGSGLASAVGLVPGKLREDQAEDMAKLAELLEVSAESIQNKLSAKWVKGDSLVPIENLEKVDEKDLISMVPNEDNLNNQALQEELLSIPGVMITDVSVRYYPLHEKAAHLTGYVQQVTAEDLEQHQGEGYTADSVIGRSGMEALYEKELKGTNGCEISIVSESGQVKRVLAAQPRADGQSVTLTIDSVLQENLYDAFWEDKSCSAAMNPVTGEVLALVSTPSFDDNDFILGMSDSKWTLLNEDEKKPMYNRFRQKWCPGSSLKPITGAIGLAAGAIDPNEDYKSEGLSWQKDSSWGKYMVTTLHDYSPVVLENAFIYSDNIYFAKAALKTGAKDLASGFDRLGFNQQLPFEITMAKSQYSNTETIETEIQLADSGYGQGQILVNPLHMAALYTAFINDGNVIKPYLLYQPQPQPEIWLPGAFSSDVVNIIEPALKKVISSEHGTGRTAYRSDIALAGKTGTAEIKASKEDTTGTELGWFAVYTADPGFDTPILLVSMVEDVKHIGGSGYVVRKDKAVLDMYFPAGI